ncbi:MAG: lytic transglycosylase domain-containing protein, partial [Christensenellales bacterium]|nr:lytic transglycosylase domain-containing protein [Christensenellales bacterium]
MSENTPMRRRRPPQPVQIDDASIPHKSDEDNPVRPAREMPPHRRVRVVPIETTDDDAPRHLPESPLSSLPTPVRFGALTLALILLIVGSVSITRTYLAHQEERRRLEAEAAERAQHPLYYADTITAYADAQELDPALVAAVILCESSYDPKAESRLGARGLMQLMPDTAEWVAHKLGEDGADYSFDNLYDPQTNI